MFLQTAKLQLWGAVYSCLLLFTLGLDQNDHLGQLLSTVHLSKDKDDEQKYLNIPKDFQQHKVTVFVGRWGGYSEQLGPGYK